LTRIEKNKLVKIKHKIYDS